MSVAMAVGAGVSVLPAIVALRLDSTRPVLLELCGRVHPRLIQDSDHCNGRA